MRWQGLAQAWQGHEVERLRKAAQSSMAAQKWRERWQCQAQARQSQEVEALREAPQSSIAGPKRWRWQTHAGAWRQALPAHSPEWFMP